MAFFTKTNKINLFVPNVEFKSRLKKVLISGVSRMPDPGEFYSDLVKHMESHFLAYKNNLFIEFYFDYINTGSSKWLYFLLQHMDALVKKRGGNVQITWKYDEDDESIEETGQVLNSQLSIPMVLQAIQD